MVDSIWLTQYLYLIYQERNIQASKIMLLVKLSVEHENKQLLSKFRTFYYFIAKLITVRKDPLDRLNITHYSTYKLQMFF